MKDVLVARPRLWRSARGAGLWVLVVALLASAGFGAAVTDKTKKDAPLPPANPAFGARVAEGLVAFYSFTEPAGGVARDSSGVGAPLALNANANVSFLPTRNGVRIANGGLLTSGAATKISQALSATGQFTFEVWAKATNIAQTGPARLLSISADTNNRNFTLGPDGGDVEVRVRTSSGDSNGSPALVKTGLATAQEDHYIVSFDGQMLRLYRNGQMMAAEARQGDLSNWDTSFPLLVGNEATNDRQWLGDVYLVAAYDRALNAAEIARNYGTGSNPANPNPVGNQPPSVDLGLGVTVLWPANAAMLDVTITDDGLPNHSLRTSWSTTSGPGTVVVRPLSADQWMAVVPAPGLYTLRLDVTDGAASGFDEVTINAAASSRVVDGLVAFYPLNEGVGKLALEQSGSSGLHLALGGDVAWLDGRNGVHVEQSGRLTSQPAGNLVNSIVAANEFSVEVWARPANTTQTGPARLVTNSISAEQRNFMLGQHRDGLRANVRTSQGSSATGSPELQVNTVAATRDEHWVLSYDGSEVRLYRDGMLEKAETRSGNLSNWDASFPLIIGNEATEEKPFRGDVYLVAIYNRALSELEVDRNFRVGADLSGGGLPVPNQAPITNAGADQTVVLPSLTALLGGAVVDDGLPGNAVTAAWSVVSKPNGATATFANSSRLSTSVAFSVAGVYVLRLSASDGALTGTDDLTVTVTNSLRVTNGLLALYPLSEGSGSTAADQSGAGTAVDLALNGKVSWLAGRNGVSIAQDGALFAATAPKLHAAITANNAFTFEIWTKPQTTSQYGPARIFSYSADENFRNFTLGQQGTRVELRVRTSRNGGENGWPYLQADGILTTEVQHYVATFDGEFLRLYRNGQLVKQEVREDDLSTWDPTHGLAIGNGLTIDRSWRGEVYLAAVYDRALNDLEVRRNYGVGDNLAGGGTPVSNLAPRPNAGPDQSVALPNTTARLSAQAIDDGLPNGTVSVSWTKTSGPGTVTFADATAAVTEATFSVPGVYNLRVRANDGELQGADDVRITITDSARVTRGLVAYYPFLEGSGSVAHDNSGFGEALDLKITGEVTWNSSRNGVNVTGTGRLLSDGPATKLYQAITESNEFTFELWLRAGNATQSGPARMLSYGLDPYTRNFMMGQQITQFVTRLRTTGSTLNGSPDITIDERVGVAFDHWVVTYDGRTVYIYKNGQLLISERREGDISNWDPSYPLALVNEVTNNRPWRGEMLLAAIYDRRLSLPEINRNRLTGWNLSSGGNPVVNTAPILSLEHDRTIALPNGTIAYTPTAIDDGLPNDTLTAEWTVLEGPGTVAFSNPSAIVSSATFSVAGNYRLRLRVSDGGIAVSQDSLIRVIAAEVPRLLDQATWGSTPALLEQVISQGPAAWINNQLQTTPAPYPLPSNDSFSHIQANFFDYAVNRNDQLRQRMAFALSQIMVVSANAVGSQYQMVPWVKMMNDQAFGNFYDLMRSVTLSPTMGDYLDMVNNAKATPDGSVQANENYARELMQLFTLGKLQRRMDGSIITGADGMPLPAYVEADVLELARVFTGWTYPTKPGKSLRWPNPEHHDGPMVAYEPEHDTGAKVFLGLNMPAGQTAAQDLAMALTHIFQQPSVAPFISRQLIQHLVTSNPSPAYIGRVAAAFANNGSGVRGDLKAVIRAILLDPEASISTPAGGHLREPVLYTVRLLRNLGATAGVDNRIAYETDRMGQNPFYPPSVFNYFSPDYVIPETGLFGPEFQIHTSSKAFARANFAYGVTRGSPGGNVSVSIDPFVAVAQNTTGLLKLIDERLFQYRMSAKLTQTIRDAVEAETDSTVRARIALYIAATSSEYQVQH